MFLKQTARSSLQPRTQKRSHSSYAYFQDDYDYDALNRLSSVIETFGASGTTASTAFKQAYTYDRFGNRTINQSKTYGVSAAQSELNPQTNQEVAEPSNRLYAPGDSARLPSQKLMRYDASGNLIYDGYTGQGARVYDAENRLIQAQDIYQGWSTYTYDADGRRVKRYSQGEEWWQVYGMGGELLAEYRAGAASYIPSKEYGYRGGQLLVTMSSGDDQRLKRFVTNIYYGALRRDPTPQELQNASNQLATAGAQGQSQLLGKAKQVARALFTQTAYETLSPARTDSQYVSDLYYAYLQRAADDSGLNFWVSQLASKGRSGVCDDFQNSIEFDVLVTTLYGNAASDNQRTEQFVTNFYLGAYGRFPTPTELQQGRDQLNAAAAQGQDVVKTQAETFGRALFAAQVSNLSIPAQQFVTNLYEGFLQRGPDASGLSFWTTQAGTTVAGRQNVLNAFATCPPFRELSGILYRETFWLVADHLGTPRMVVDKSGSLVGIKRHDYLPFGEELLAGTGGRTPQQGYAASDNIRQKFTGKEHDDETRLDYFGARYYSSYQGRFISPDLLLSAGRPMNPQTWNHYSYTLGNPLRFNDPSGFWEWDASLGGPAKTADLEKGDKVQRRQAELRKKFMAKLEQAKNDAADNLSGNKLTKVMRALDAYGKEGVANNVTVGIGGKTDPNKPGATDPNFDLNMTTKVVSTSIEVTFDESVLDGKNSWRGGYVIAHEGAHVANSLDFAEDLKKYNIKAYNSASNLSQLQDETSAFEVTSYLLEANNTDGAQFGATVWEKSWRKLDETTREANRAKSIADYIRDTPGYGFYADPAKPYMVGNNLQSSVHAHWP